MAPEVVGIDFDTPRAMLPLVSEEAREARTLALHGGRGSAKSHFFAELMIERCITEPTRAMCIREHQVSLQNSAKQLIEDKIRKFGLTQRFRVLNNIIEIPENDGLIIFQGMKNHTSDSIKSFEGFDIAWFEEAQNCSQRSLDLLRPTIRKPRSQLWYSWNPKKKTDPVDKHLRKEKPDDAIVIEVNYYDNPWFPEVLRKEMEYDRKRDPERYKHIWLGQYESNLEARVFKNFRLAEEGEIAASIKGLHPMFGADFGFAKDPTVLIKLYVDLNKRRIYIVREAYKIGCEIDETPALFRTIEGSEDYPITADNSRPETISYLRRFGFPKVRPSIKGPNSVKEGVNFLKQYDIIVDPSCIHTYDELSMYSYEIDPMTNDVLPELGEDKNHVIDAARYAIEKLRRAKLGLWG